MGSLSEDSYMGWEAARPGGGLRRRAHEKATDQLPGQRAGSRRDGRPLPSGRLPPQVRLLQLPGEQAHGNSVWGSRVSCQTAMSFSAYRAGPRADGAQPSGPGTAASLLQGLPPPGSLGTSRGRSQWPEPVPVWDGSQPGRKDLAVLWARAHGVVCVGVCLLAGLQPWCHSG